MTKASTTTVAHNFILADNASIVANVKATQGSEMVGMAIFPGIYFKSLFL